ncbi:MAG TPA: thioether cross-link-forming SCIFF peptide maturase [Ruminococcaceae bacterium]|nr:thioether cross-link-forming SCIFF peptide maturase [Oscillospiraceae bacterium]
MIHKYKLNGYNILLDVYSGAVHIIDELCFELLELISEEDITADSRPSAAFSALAGRYAPADIEEAYAELRSLFLAGQLFSKDDYGVFADKIRPAPVKAMCLHIAHDCNLRCEYCFAAKGDFGRGRKLMDFETGKKAIDFLIEQSSGRHNLEVDFFGGEPLMNMDTVKRLVAYARSLEKLHNKKFRFTLTTNGLLLDSDNMDFINAEMSNVVLSIDGRKEINDRLRVTPGGKGSYDVIVPKYQELVKRRGRDKHYYVRGTFTGYNPDFTKDVLRLYELGFDQISVEPVVSEQGLPYAINPEDLPRIFTEYETLAKTILEMKRRGDKINFFHFMLEPDSGPCAIKRLRGCGCGNEYVAVTPEGDIYPCHQFVGNEDYKMGSVYSGELDTGMKERFSKTSIYHKPDCRDCWAKFYCSGGCNANNLQYAGDINTPHEMSCRLGEKRLECALMIMAALAE